MILSAAMAEKMKIHIARNNRAERIAGIAPTSVAIMTCGGFVLSHKLIMACFLASSVENKSSHFIHNRGIAMNIQINIKGNIKIEGIPEVS